MTVLTGRRGWCKALMFAGIGLVPAYSFLHGESVRGTVLPAGLQLSDTGLRSGDLVFRRTRSLEGRVVQRFEPQTEFTHVGIVWMDVAGASVVHATPDPTGAWPEGGVVREPLAAFLSTHGIEAASVFRWTDADDLQARDMAAKALAWVNRPFDLSFESEKPIGFHCTELVWHAVSSLGVRDTPLLLRIKGLPSGLQVLTLEVLIESLNLDRIKDAKAE